MLSNRNYHVMVVHHESGDLYLKVIEFSEKRSKEFFDTFEGMLRARMHIIQRLYGKETVWELTE